MVPHTPEQQFEAIQTFAAQGYPWAQQMLAQRYKNGNGVAQSYEKAIELYTLAVSQYNTSAMVSLGALYYNGHGIKRCYKSAFFLWQQAALEGKSAKAACNLGSVYANGHFVDQNYALAKLWWTRAASQGHQLAVQNLKLLDRREREMIATSKMMGETKESTVETVETVENNIG